MTDSKDAKLVIRLPRTLLNAAKEQAQLEDITVSQYVRRCLMKWVGIFPQKDEAQEEASQEKE